MYATAGEHSSARLLVLCLPCVIVYLRRTRGGRGPAPGRLKIGPWCPGRPSRPETNTPIPTDRPRSGQKTWADSNSVAQVSGRIYRAAPPTAEHITVFVDIVFTCFTSYALLFIQSRCTHLSSPPLCALPSLSGPRNGLNTASRALPAREARPSRAVCPGQSAASRTEAALIAAPAHYTGIIWTRLTDDGRRLR